jgi:hypothetical protein
MAGKRWTGSVYQDLATKKRWNGSAWVDLTVAKRWTGSAWVDVFGATDIVPFAPLITVGTSGLKLDDYVDINWTTNSNLATTQYQVERATNSTFTTGLTVVKAYHTFAGTSSTFRDTTMAAKTTYYYRVLARNGSTSTASTNLTVTVNLLMPYVMVEVPYWGYFDITVTNRNVGVPNIEYGWGTTSTQINNWTTSTFIEGSGSASTVYVVTRDGSYTTQARATSF